MLIRIEAIWIHGAPASAVVYEHKRASRAPQMRGLLLEPVRTSESSIEAPPGRTPRTERPADSRLHGVQPVVRFRCAAGVGHAAWMGGEVVTGLEYDVEMDCDAPVRVQPDGTLTSEPSGSCRLDGQIEQVDPDGMLTLRVGEGLIVAEMDAAQTAPSVGRPVVVLDVPLTVWTQGGGRLDVHDDHVLPIGRRDVRVKLRRRFSPVTDAAYPASIVRVVGLVAAWVVRWIMRTRQWTVAVTIGPDQEHGSERVVHVERAANEAAAVHRAAELKQVLERVADTPQRLSGPLASDEQLANIIRRAVKRQGGDWTNPTVPV